MSLPRLYVLLPETNPSNCWMHSNNAQQNETAIREYFKKVEKIMSHLSFEEFEGLFDSVNVQNCLEHFEVLHDYYPYPVTIVLRDMLRNFYDWRTQQLQSAEKQYEVLNVIVNDHTFCENAENGLTQPPLVNAVLNIDAHNLGDAFDVMVNGAAVRVTSISSIQVLTDWFGMHRHPQRNFKISPKHGENRTDIRYIGGEMIYPFRSSLAEGQRHLKTAIGLSTKEIFSLDGDNGFIVFKYEGDNPQNMYHGYHVELDSKEVPDKVRKILNERLAN